MQRMHLTLAFLFGAVVALSAALVVTNGRLPEAYAQTAGNNEFLALMGFGNQQKGSDQLFLFDTKSQRLAIYNLQGRQLELLAVRNIAYDLKFEEYSTPGATQKPSVGDVRDKTREEDSKPTGKKK